MFVVFGVSPPLPVPTPCLISLVSDSTTSRLTCAEPTAPTHLGEVATHDTHVSVTNPADRTVKKDPLNSWARSVGWLAQFGVGLREPARGDGKCHQAPIYYGALVTEVRSPWPPVCARPAGGRRAIAALHPKQARKQAHDATPVARGKHDTTKTCSVRERPGKANKNDAQPSGLA